MKKVLQGVVSSDKMNKTRIVLCERFTKHKRIKKYMKLATKCYVHDERNLSKAGDRVEIIENKPLSKLKRWNLVKILT